MLPNLLLALVPLLSPSAIQADDASRSPDAQQGADGQQPANDVEVPAGVLQDAGDSYVLDLSELPDGGLTLLQFIKVCQINTGLNFTLDESTATGIRNKLEQKRLLLYGPKTIRKDEFYSFFQIMMKIHGFVCVQQGSGSLAVIVITEQLASNMQLIKSNALFVEEKDVPEFSDKPGTFIFTVVKLKWANATEFGSNLRTALGSNTGDSSAFMSLTQDSGLLVQGYGPFVAASVRMIRVLDVEPDLPKPVFKKVRLLEADATEMADILGTLVESLAEVEEQRTQNRRGTNQPAVRVNTAVEAYDPDNSLLITASSDNIDQILDLVAQLDTRVEDPESNFHVFQLQHLSVGQLQNLAPEQGSAGEEGESLPGASNTERLFTDFWDEVVAAEEAAEDSGGQGNTQRRSREQEAVISFNDATNTVIVSATRSKWLEIKDLLELLDRPQPQVLVQAALIEVSDDFERSIGLEYAAVDLPEGQDNEHFVFTSVGITQADQIGDPRLPSPTLPGLTYGIFDGADLGIPVILNAVQNSSDANVLSVPSVLVANNQLAAVESIEVVQVPNSTVNQGVVSNNFFELEAGIKLYIRPSISAGNFLRLAVRLEVSSFRAGSQAGQPPDKLTRNIETQVTLPDGATMWLGGIKRDDFLSSEEGIPYLSDIPLIGWLFGKRTKSNVKTTLFFFCTPRIIDDFRELEDLSREGKAQAAETIGLERVRMIDPEFRLESPEDVILGDRDGDGVDDSASLNLPAFAAPAYASGGGVVDPEFAGADRSREEG